MTSRFFDVYIANLSVLSNELEKHQRSIHFVTDSIKALTSNVHQKFQHFVGEMMKEPTLYQNDDAVRDSQIKVIYFQIRQIQKFEAEKRALTRASCNILDKYLASLGQEVKSAQERPVNADDKLLAETLASIQLQLDQPLTDGAVVIDMIQKMEDRTSEQRDGEDNVMDLYHVNQAINLFRTVEKCKKLTLDDMLGLETKSITSGMTRQPDSLQTFTEKIIDICSEIKRRHGASDTADAATNNDDEETSTETFFLLCHCRSPELGSMVECENKHCKIIWYHFECVGLHRPPGEWQCPTCTIFAE